VKAKRIALVGLGALAIMLAVSAPSQAAGGDVHHLGGGHGGGAVAQHGSEGRHFEGRHFEGHHFEGHDFDGHHFEGHPFEEHHFEGHGRFGFGPVVPFYAPYYVAPSYWYYCPSDQAYYPSVASCPEPWVPVPAQ
jgi:hypothetical protein